MSISGYNMFFTMATILGFGTWILLLWLKVRKNRTYKVVIIFLLPTLLLIALFFMLMQTYAIEAVHFFQYAILAILIFPLIKSYGATVFWATFFGMLDEIYQYTILTPYFEYFDINDILLNLLGAGVAVVTIYLSTGFRTTRSDRIKGTRAVLYFVILVGIIYTILHLGNYISWYPATSGDQPLWFAISRTPSIERFWTEAYPGKFLHIIGPWEGLAISLILFGYYFLLDWVPGNHFLPRK
jgi:VanZ family protein